jgi:transcription termination factor NusB
MIKGSSNRLLLLFINILILKPQTNKIQTMTIVEEVQEINKSYDNNVEYKEAFVKGIEKKKQKIDWNLHQMFMLPKDINGKEHPIKFYLGTARSEAKGQI